MLPLASKVTTEGSGTLAAFGVDVAALRRSRRRFAVSCLDWTERRAHLAGALGAIVGRARSWAGIIRRPPKWQAVSHANCDRQR
ncbi:MAG TPA: hypothetical protein VMV92_19545 [Streptosporangiaceae bacterium]|nr:hypothetical protein [Streptosporangiaceae bacterium]